MSLAWIGVASGSVHSSFVVAHALKWLKHKLQERASVLLSELLGSLLHVAENLLMHAHISIVCRLGTFLVFKVFRCPFKWKIGLFTHADLNVEVIGWCCLLQAAKSVLNACGKLLMKFINFLICGKKMVKFLVCLVKSYCALYLLSHATFWNQGSSSMYGKSVFGVKICFLLSWVSALLKHNLVSLCYFWNLCTGMP